MNTKKEKAREAIESTLMVIKSVEFLENESKKIFSKMEKLEKRLESSTCFAEKEELYKQLELLEPNLRQLIRKCELENINIDNCIKQYNNM